MLTQKSDFSIQLCQECKQNRPCRWQNKQGKWWCDYHAAQIFVLSIDKPTVPVVAPLGRNGRPRKKKNYDRLCEVCNKQFTPNPEEPRRTCSRKCAEVLRIRAYKKSVQARRETRAANTNAGSK